MKEFTSVNDILDFAIRAEQEAVDFYSGLAESARNQEIARVFRQFAMEEMEHKARLSSIKEQGMLAINPEKVIDLKIADYTVKVQPTPEMTYKDALVLAMQKEKAAFKLYLRLSENAPGDELKNLFLILAQEESKHKLRFELEYDEFVLREN